MTPSLIDSSVTMLSTAPAAPTRWPSADFGAVSDRVVAQRLADRPGLAHVTGHRGGGVAVDVADVRRLQPGVAHRLR